MRGHTTLHFIFLYWFLNNYELIFNQYLTVNLIKQYKGRQSRLWWINVLQFAINVAAACMPELGGVNGSRAGLAQHPPLTSFVQLQEAASHQKLLRLSPVVLPCIKKSMCLTGKYRTLSFIEMNLPALDSVPTFYTY